MLNWFDMDYKNQAVSKDLSLAEIKLMLTSIIVIIITKGKIKNSGEKDVIYTILIISKHRILPKSKKLQDIYLIILSFA